MGKKKIDFSKESISIINEPIYYDSKTDFITLSERKQTVLNIYINEYLTELKKEIDSFEVILKKEANTPKERIQLKNDKLHKLGSLHWGHPLLIKKFILYNPYSVIDKHNYHTYRINALLEYLVGEYNETFESKYGREYSMLIKQEREQEIDKYINYVIVFMKQIANYLSMVENVLEIPREYEFCNIDMVRLKIYDMGKL